MANQITIYSKEQVRNSYGTPYNPKSFHPDFKLEPVELRKSYMFFESPEYWLLRFEMKIGNFTETMMTC